MVLLRRDENNLTCKMSKNGPRGASLAIFVSLAGASRSVVAVGFDDAR